MNYSDINRNMTLPMRQYSLFNIIAAAQMAAHSLSRDTVWSTQYELSDHEKIFAVIFIFTVLGMTVFTIIRLAVIHFRPPTTSLPDRDHHHPPQQ